MATPKPVPSRAALNTLRGLVFTTSCSVAFLAEERRRRSKVAKAAIDNARKLSTAKARRRMHSQAESSQTFDSDLEFLYPPRQSDLPVRRKGPASSQKQQASIPHDSPQTHSRKPSRTNISRRDDGSEGLLGLSLAMHPTKHSETSTMSAPQQPPEVLKKPAFIKLPETSMHPLLQNLCKKFIALKDPFSTEPEVQTAISALLHAVQSNDNSHVEPLVADILAYFVRTSPHAQAHQEANTFLEALLEKLELPGTSTGLAVVYRQLAIEICSRTFGHGRFLELERTNTEKRLTMRHRNQLIRDIFLRSPCQIPSAIVLASKSSTHKSSPSRKSNGNELKALAPILFWLVEINHIEGIQNILRQRNLSDLTPAGAVIQSASLRELLRIYSKKYSVADAQHLCEVLQAAVSASASPAFILQPQTLYKAHQDLALEAYRAGQVKSCLVGMKKLVEINPEQLNNDPALGPCRLLRDIFSDPPFASKSDSQEIDDTALHAYLEGRLEQMERVLPPSAREFPTLLWRAIDVWALQLSPRELEAVVRISAERYEQGLEEKWVSFFFDHHSERRHHQDMISWLGFCVDRGHQFSDAFVSRMYAKFRSHWHLNDQEIFELYEDISETCPSLPPPRKTNILNGEPRHRNRADRRNGNDRHSWETVYIRLASNLKPRNFARDGKAFNEMQNLALQGQWEGVWSLYEHISPDTASLLPFARLGVLARLRLDKGHSSAALSLVDDLVEKGLDASPVMLPVLMAQLEGGCDPSEVVSVALARGMTLDDMIYNRAAQICNANAKYADAIDLCLVAARENGAGSLLYNQFNFANVLFAYIRKAQYKELGALLLDFVSERRWWAGDKTCTASIKLAMKTTARRVTYSRHPLEAERHKNVLATLSLAFEHGVSCRSSKPMRADLAHSVAGTFTKSAKGPKRPSKDTVAPTLEQMRAEPLKAVG